MKKVLYDANVVLDVLLKRKPYYIDSAKALDAVGQGYAVGYIPAHVVTTLYYLLRRSIGSEQSKQSIIRLLEKVQVAAETDALVRQALQSSFKDFEDAVCHAAALDIGAEVIVTRNEDDFKNSQIAVMTPIVFCAEINLNLNS